MIAGTATAGIPHAAWVAEILDLPMVYIRSKAKDHGKGNQIEGRIFEGQKMVVIEDLISTGGSVLEAAEAAKEKVRISLVLRLSLRMSCQKEKQISKKPKSLL